MTGSADRTVPQALGLFGRLRSWNLSSWRHGDRIEFARSTLDVLAALAAAQDGRPRPAVPDVGVHALADQLQVLTVDALEAGVEVREVSRVVADLAGRLGLSQFAHDLS